MVWGTIWFCKPYGLKLDGFANHMVQYHVIESCSHVMVFIINIIIVL